MLILHFWWYFSHNLDMVEIEKCQLLDTRLNVQSPFAPSAYFSIKFIYFWLHSLMSTNGQLNDTLCYHKKTTNSMCNVISCFHLKEPCSLFFVSSQFFFSFSKSVINKKYLDKYKNKTNLFKNLVLRWKFASV